MTSELSFIAALRQIATHPGARGLDDDCALLEIGGETLILTHDSMAEGVHYLASQDPADIAWKLVASNLSDLAAKGAEPLGALLGYQFGKDDARFVEGLREVLEYHRVPLLGGDTIAGNGGQVLGLTAIGRATHSPVPDRRGARPGDDIYVTGTLGAAMLGFEALKKRSGDSLAFRRPKALLAEGRALAPHVSAMLDVSDGLLLDAWRMARASDVTFNIETQLVPVVDQKRLAECIRWGEDYQLLFTAQPHEILPVAATRIGQATVPDIAALWVDGQPMTPEDGLGYEHR